MSFFERSPSSVYDPDASPAPIPRRKVFLSYHKDDAAEAIAFRVRFHERAGVFTSRMIHPEIPGSIINSSDEEYVMRTIRETYLSRESSVTIVLLGRNTWRRRYVDWEIKASLSTFADTKPNGLIGIWLPSTVNHYRVLPHRLEMNLRPRGAWGHTYAQLYEMPESPDLLAAYLELAATARERLTTLIDNTAERLADDIK